ncbi:hypothetical protein [Pararhodobacter aggregans]|uniref:hypothetical protein n=1 Tax=Pararhodobacter aggregans TaxID=404875 RepID=UPI003A929192
MHTPNRSRPLHPLRAGKEAARRLLRGAALALCGLGLSMAPGAAQGQDTPGGRPAFHDVGGRMMIDYSALRLTSGGDFDLMGVHYLQDINDWLSFGAGASAPIAGGNYGGFFAADMTLHAQRDIGRNFFVNAGIALGAGAGGASVNGIRRLSGEGFYGRVYAGIGYHLRRFSFGVNYSRVAIAGSELNDSALNFFVQVPFSFAVGRYGDAGRVLTSDEFRAPQHQNIVSLQFNHVRQINPTGLYQGDIGFASTQFTHFHNPTLYSYFAVDIGATGLLWYNQAHGGVGGRVALGRNVNLYAQLGIGSGGWVTDTIDTGSGFIIYPKVTLEYLWGNGVGTTLSAGYFYAPFGTSRNWTVGLGLNYHLSHPERRGGGTLPGAEYTLRGFRLNVFGRVTSPIYYNGRESAGLTMLALQADYMLNERWYLAGQIAAATNAFRGFAGYAEGFFGAGWQTRTFAGGRLQGYAQVLYGLNDVGVDRAREVGALLYPSIGVNYHLNERVSLYGQFGATVSLGRYMNASMTNSWRNTSIGLGLTYRFALPTRS